MEVYQNIRTLAGTVYQIAREKNMVKKKQPGAKDIWIA